MIGLESCARSGGLKDTGDIISDFFSIEVTLFLFFSRRSSLLQISGLPKEGSKVGVP